jgi:hypothetical protein
MRHRQTTGAGPSGTRPSIVVLLLTAAGGGLAAGIDQPAGAWAGYGVVSVAALIGCGTLWQQRGQVERRSKEMARRRRADLAEAAGTEQGRRAEIDRLRADLEHEQQYSVLVQDQLARAREQLDRERAARRAAERTLDALTGADGWTPDAAEADPAETDAASDDGVGTRVRPSTVRPSTVLPLTGASAAQRRGWQVVDGEGRDADEVEFAAADRIYRPFLDQSSAPAVPISDAALAMAPVIGADLDGLLDLTAYDETVEFTVREFRGLAK